MKNIKIVWICSLNPSEIVHSSNYFNQKKTVILSPWIDLSIDYFKQRKYIELHIISIDKNLKRDIIFEDNNIIYHFFANQIPILKKPMPFFFNFFIDFYFIKQKIKKAIKNINPDIVDCHGTDQLFSAIINSIKIPTIITLSCFIMDFIKINKCWYNRLRFIIEKRVIKKQNNFGIRANFMKDNILKYNPNAQFFWYNYPIKKPIVSTTEIQKKYDIAFFARLEKNKGIEDFIEIVYKLKKDFKEIKAIVIGGSANKDYFEYLKQQAKEKDVYNNIEFTGFIPSINDVYEKLASAKLYLLPTYFDMIPGSLIEAMYLKIPSISYNVGGISDLNVLRQSIILIEPFDLEQMFIKCSLLLNNPELASELGISGYKTVNEMYYMNNPINEMINAYYKILFKK